jgi:hypothetical protein
MRALDLEDDLLRLYREGKELSNERTAERLGTVKEIIRGHEAGYMKE